LVGDEASPLDRGSRDLEPHHEPLRPNGARIGPRERRGRGGDGTRGVFVGRRGLLSRHFERREARGNETRERTNGGESAVTQRDVPHRFPPPSVPPRYGTTTPSEASLLRNVPVEPVAYTIPRRTFESRLP